MNLVKPEIIAVTQKMFYASPRNVLVTKSLLVVLYGTNSECLGTSGSYYVRALRHQIETRPLIMEKTVLNTL